MSETVSVDSCASTPYRATVIDPQTSLAFAVQSQPGAYAVLVGSGVSRGANIPTGWGIVNELVRRLAAASGETIVGEPAEWYEHVHSEAVSFTKLLAELAPSRTERQSILRGFIEPHPERPGERQPTAAHRALASLARSGHVRVFLTTNFDRLLETALSDSGLTPLIVASPAAAQGAAPFHRHPAVVFKLHGDYLDPDSMLVTEDELAAYEPPVSDRLSRVLEEQGLIVCGWSADWDPALRNAITAASARRYPMYFANRGAVSPTVESLVAVRHATTLDIADADGFFTDLAKRVEAIDLTSRPHPLDTRALVAGVKTALPRPERRIELEDLVMGAANDAAQQLQDPDFFPTHVGGGETEFLRAFVLQALRSVNTVEPLAHVLSAGAVWGEPHQTSLWTRAVARVASTHAYPTGSINEALVALRRLPTLVCIYAAGIGAVSRGNYAALKAVTVDATHTDERGHTYPLLGALSLWDVLIDGRFAVALADVTEGRGELDDDYLNSVVRRSRKVGAAPHSGFLEAWTRPILRNALPDDHEFAGAFERFEMLVDLLLADLERELASAGLYINGPSIGRYGRTRSFGSQTPEEALRDEFTAAAGAEWPPVAAGLFGGDHQRAAAAFDGIANKVEEVRRSRPF